jgi:hypothetical protein
LVEVWALGEDRFAVRAPGHEQIVESNRTRNPPGPLPLYCPGATDPRREAQRRLRGLPLGPHLDYHARGIRRRQANLDNAECVCIAGVYE